MRYQLQEDIASTRPQSPELSHADFLRINSYRISYRQEVSEMPTRPVGDVDQSRLYILRK